VDLGRDTAITWLGHATLDIQTPGGKRVLVDPWLEGNPACPEDQRERDACDILAVTHGHFDHIHDAVPVARQHSPQVVGIPELLHWLESKGVENTNGFNKGGTQVVDGVGFTMTHAVHSCGITDGDRIVYGGEACGYVMTMENGFKIYFAGDTALFGDMKLIGELWQPDLAILPIGDHFTMDPKAAAYALRLLGCKLVLPVHYGTFPILAGTPAQLREAASDIEGLQVFELSPGETLR
jgi:L-ascorbate metabolism protein UlaG (beta-lactamase superfamily)